MSKPKIVVVGSSNTDMIVKSPHIPAPGETVLGGIFATAAGGKGATRRLPQRELAARSSLSRALATICSARRRSRDLNGKGSTAPR